MSSCEPFSIPGSGGVDDDNGTINDSSSDETGEDDTSDGEEPVESITACGTIQLGLSGDLGAVCETGACTNTNYDCSHYWDYTNRQHKCACTETFFCQLNYSYPYGSVCECPPNSHEQVGNDVGDYMCVSD